MEKSKCKHVDFINLTNSSVLAIAHKLNTYKAADIVNLYFPPALIGLGVFVNILSILVMRSPYFRKVSTTVYLTAGAINDLMGLSMALLPHWLFVNYSHVYKRGRVTDGLCKFLNFYGYSTTDATLTFTACMTADRAYAIKFPLRVATANTVRRARVVVLVSSVAVMMKNFHLCFLSAMSAPWSTERLCDVSPQGEGLKYYVEAVSLCVCGLSVYECV